MGICSILWELHYYTEGTMNKARKIVIMILMAFAMISPITLSCIGNIAYITAATVKISKKSLSLEEGKTHVLKITGTKKKITWKSSNTAVATVTSKGKVNAKSAGIAKITAKVGDKTYSCNVTVTAKTVKNSKNKTTKESIEDFTVSIPKDWIFYVDAIAAPSPDQVDKVHRYKLKPLEAAYGNDIVITTEILDTDTTKYEDVKKEVSEQYLLTIKELENFGDNKVSDIVTDDITTELGSAFHATYKLISDGVTYNITAYKFYYKNYAITLEVSETEDLGLNSVAINLINSIK